MSKINLHSLDKYILDSKKNFECLLADLIEIPTVSMEPEHKSDMLRGAEMAAFYLRETGARTEIINTPGHPLVFGYLESSPGAPTVTIYHHLDVQPATPAEWNSPPFKCLIKDDNYYIGRGATDNKGPAITALLAVRFAVKEGIPLNFKFIWEMEEEIGSPNFAAAIESKKEDLAADSIIVSDTTWISRDKPAIPHGLRGLMTATLTLTTGQRDTHSGLTGGGARNPIGELCSLISRCYDPVTGRVMIDGFYDQVRRPSSSELREYEMAGFSVSEFKKTHGFKSIRTEDASSLLNALWCEPTFEVHGITGGYTGEGVKTIVPYTAEAKISTRLVPDQKPLEIFQLLRDFVRKENADVEVNLEAVLNPYLAEFSGPYIQAAKEALAIGFGKKSVFIREGGSIGPVMTMQNTWAVPIVLLGLSLPDQGYHSANEYFDWFQASGGIKTLVHYFNLISQIS